MNTKMKKLFSVVIPVYSNELNLPITIPYIMNNYKKLFSGYDFELVLVNDGSPDNSWQIMQEYQKQYPDTIRIASFTRNFGQVMATRYGIEIASGDFVGVISADLQDPLELFADMLKILEDGADLVCGVRANRQEKGLGVIFSKITHFLINKFISRQYPIGGFDFFAMNRENVNRFLQLHERNASAQLQLLWVSSNIHFLNYSRKEREIGKSGWTFSKKIKYFIDTFISNSYLPVRIMSVGGIICAAIAFIYTIIIIFGTLIKGSPVPGWSSLAALIALFSGLILMSLGILGEYLWRIYDEVKGRPMYLVKKTEQ